MTTPVPSVEQIFLQFANNNQLSSDEVAILMNHVSVLKNNVETVNAHFQQKPNVVHTFWTSKSVNSLSLGTADFGSSGSWKISDINQRYSLKINNTANVLDDNSALTNIVDDLFHNLRAEDHDKKHSSFLQVFHDFDHFCESLGISWFDFISMHNHISYTTPLECDLDSLNIT